VYTREGGEGDERWGGKGGGSRSRGKRWGVKGNEGERMGGRVEGGRERGGSRGSG